mgnify:FL=1
METTTTVKVKNSKSKKLNSQKTNVYVLATGSDGNQVVFEYKGHFLVIDAGVDYFKGDPEKTEIIYATHYHYDHACYMMDYAKKGYKTNTYLALAIDHFDGKYFSFDTHYAHHGSGNSYTLVITNKETGEKFLYATDLQYLPNSVLELNQKYDKVLIEINYCKDKLEEAYKSGEIDYKHYDGKKTHLSFEKFVDQGIINFSNEFVILHSRKKFLDMDEVNNYFQKHNKKLYFEEVNKRVLTYEEMLEILRKLQQNN